MTNPARRSTDPDEQNIEEICMIIRAEAARLGFTVAKLVSARSRLDPDGWTTIEVQLTQVPASRRNRVVRGG